MASLVSFRERDMDAKTCIFMEDKKTIISNFHVSTNYGKTLVILCDKRASNMSFLSQAPGASCDQSDKKDFTFDFSYWSADSSDKHYASQEQVSLICSNKC